MLVAFYRITISLLNERAHFQTLIKSKSKYASNAGSSKLKYTLSPSHSVTRLGEISPLWQKIPSLWQIFVSLFPMWQNAKPTLANLYHYWAHFHCYKWPNIDK